MARRATTSTAWLESIELENVRCFRERQTIPFTTRDGKKAQWTLLLGENGTGKSTLLQVCAMLMPTNWEFLEQEQPVPPLLPLRNWDQFTSGVVESRSHLAISLEFGGSTFRWSWQIRHKTPFAISTSKEAPASQTSSLPLPLRLAYAPYRSAQEFIPESTNSTGVEGLLRGFTRLRHAKEWFQDYTLATVSPKSRNKAEKILQRVRETLFRILPDVTDFRIDTQLEGGVLNQLLAETPFGWVNIDELGFGYQSILAMVVDIASRLIEHYPHSPNPLAEPAVILIDEVDLHLHPKWQRTLQQELSEQFPNAQFIATAHSPLVVQSSPEANVLLLKREGDHVVVERAPEVIKTWRVDQILTSDLFGLPTARPPQLDSLIQERDKILGAPELTKADEKRLKELEEQIGSLPGGETPWQMKAMALINKAAKDLEAKNKATPTTRTSRTTKRRG
jgi:predicted ATP-binding protein involved in virulence